MICPRCNTRHQLGAERCDNCGTPFTRQAARQSGGARGPAFGPPDGRSEYAGGAIPAGHYREASRQPRRPVPRTYRRSSAPGSRAIGGLIALLIITIVIIAGAALLGSIDTGSLRDDVANQARQAVGLDGGSGEPNEPPVDVPQSPPEPAGEQTWILTQEELNRRIANRAGAFGPAEDVSVELGEGTVSVGFRAYGVDGTYHGSLTTQNGVPIVADSTIDGPLGWVVDAGEIDQVLNEEMASAAREREVSVESVRVRPGEVVFGIS